MMEFYDCVGLVGVTISMSNYAGCNGSTNTPNTWPFQLETFSAPFWSFCPYFKIGIYPLLPLNILVALISLYGVYRCLKYKWETSNQTVSFRFRTRQPRQEIEASDQSPHELTYK